MNASDGDKVNPALVRELLAAGSSLELTRLRCGCQVGTACGAFVIRPCSLRCEYYRFAMAEARRNTKPVAYGWEGNQN